MLCSLYKSSLDFWIMKPVSLLNRIKWEFCNVIISKVIIFLSSSADPMTQSDSKAESHIFWRVKLSSSFSLALEVNSENVNPSISNEKGTKWVWNCASYGPVLYFLRLAAFHCDKIMKIASNQFEQAQNGWNCDFQNPVIRVIKIEICYQKINFESIFIWDFSQFWITVPATLLIFYSPLLPCNLLKSSLHTHFKRPRAFKARPLLSLTFHLHLHHFNDFSKWLNSLPKDPQKSPKAPPS